MAIRISEMCLTQKINTYLIKWDNLANSAPLREVCHGTGNRNENCSLGGML